MDHQPFRSDRHPFIDANLHQLAWGTMMMTRNRYKSQRSINGWLILLRKCRRLRRDESPTEIFSIGTNFGSENPCFRATKQLGIERCKVGLQPAERAGYLADRDLHTGYVVKPLRGTQFTTSNVSPAFFCNRSISLLPNAMEGVGNPPGVWSSISLAKQTAASPSILPVDP